MRMVAAALLLAALAACGKHPTPAPLPQLATRTPEIIQDSGTGRRKTTLSVLIYNVAGLPWPVRWGRGWALDRIGDDLRRLQLEGRAPDLLLLQEAFTSQAGHIGIRGLYPNWVRGPKAGDDLTIETPLQNPEFMAGRRFWKGEGIGKLVSSGLYIYSNYPIQAVEMTPFGRNSCAGYDCLANKGVMMATIAIPGVPEPIQVMNTHLNARGASRVPIDRTHKAHARQLDEIHIFLGRHLRPDWPFIYGGDFNTRGSDLRYARKTMNVPGTVVRYYCTVITTDCDVRMSWDGDAPWLDTQDLQGFADGVGVHVRPVRVEAMFDVPFDGEKLSDHDGYLVTYELSWDAARP